MSFVRVRGPGDPDQACDLVAAGLVEEYLKRDPQTRIHVRVVGGHGAIFVCGEVLSTADFDAGAVVRRILAINGTASNMEPFIALDTMSPTTMPEGLSRLVVSASGFATRETPDRFPRAQSVARDIAQALERKRTTDPDWFWLGADYSVSVMKKPEHQNTRTWEVIVRAQHLETEPLEQVRTRIREVCMARMEDVEIKINVGGEEMQGGLAQAVGSSSRISGLHVRHPLQMGSILCRALARTCVESGLGTSVLVEAVWLPLEHQPSTIRIRNEKGENLLLRITPEALDMRNIPEAWLEPQIATSIVRAPFDGSVVLPWEVG
ncbi:methionine adenosyltransferase [Candidatus Uhrbacteria bacterium]|nr:methionine adenosyltransferase [Candidatus Uhrbacteria bacterium]